MTAPIETSVARNGGLGSEIQISVTGNDVSYVATKQGESQ